MIRPSDKLLADILIKNNLLSRDDADLALLEAQPGDESLTTYLGKRGLVTEAQILSLLSKSLNIPIANLKTVSVDKAVIDKIPIKFAWYYKFMPIKIEGKTLTLAVSAPLDVKIQDEIRVHLGFEPKIVLASETDVIDTFKRYYGLAADTVDRIMAKEPSKKTIAETEKAEAIEDIEKQSEDASIIKLVNQIIFEAYNKRATDIHIEPYRNKVRFRYRIDGVLVDANLPVDIKHFLLPILSRIKIMANLSIVEKRLPQDGSAVVKTKDQTLDLRISTIPTPRGESMVIRILPTKVMSFSLEKLGLDEKNVRIFRELVKKPHGIIFVTGPTGSGKTTTLYACLHEINSIARKVITIEDPVEYEMEGITQIQVSPKVNLTFAAGLRSVLRHDPDIIMVGEVRDLETAEIAIRTALTGHLVFSTLHTNDAASGVTRLIEMGLEPYLVASSVEAFVAQRLVRIICSHCKQEVKTPFIEIKKEIAQALKLEDVDDIKIYQGKGCEKCNNTGFYGRTAIHEVLVVDDAIRAAILEKPRADYIKAMAMQRGMVTLRQDGWQKVLSGITTPNEVMNVTSQEDYNLNKVSSGAVRDPADAVKPKADSAPTAYKYRVFSNEVFETKNEYDSRTYIRVDAKVKIRYKIFKQEAADPHALTFKGDDYEHSTFTKNISAGGLLFASGHSIAPGSILEFRIQLSENAPSIDCLAKICRVEEDDLAHMYHIAAYYLDITSADRSRISEFTKTKSTHKKESLT